MKRSNKNMAKERKDRPVVVTTAHRGVFVGRTSDADTAETITLLGARMIVYWDSNCHGVLGVAAKGVGRGCRVSPAVDRIVLRNITAVMEATPEAEKSRLAEPWSGS